jgi:flagellar motor component MotA
MKTLKNYYKPTPKKWRKLGDALLACAGVVGGGGILAYDSLKELYTPKELKLMIGIALVVGIAGKFLSNFFTDEKPE